MYEELGKKIACFVSLNQWNNCFDISDQFGSYFHSFALEMTNCVFRKSLSVYLLKLQWIFARVIVITL